MDSHLIYMVNVHGNGKNASPHMNQMIDELLCNTNEVRAPNYKKTFVAIINT